MSILFISLQSSNSILGMLPLLLMFVVMYFFFIRPQVKKQKEQDAFQTSLKQNDEVVTASGIIGRISKLEKSVVTIQVDDKTYMRFTKGAISKEMTDAYRKVTSA